MGLNRKLTLAFLCLIFVFGASSCKKQRTRITAPPSLPAPPSDWEIAEKSFAKGQYETAAGAYERYLQKNPDDENRNAALLRLAISYALPGTTIYYPARADSLFEEVLSDPESVYTTEARLLQHLRTEIEQLQINHSKRSSEIQQLSAELRKFKELARSDADLVLGEHSFAQGEYKTAVEAYERYLENNPDVENRERTLFRLAISYALPKSPVYDYQRAESLLKELAGRPHSSYATEAQLILDMRAEIRRLHRDDERKSKEIEQLSSELETLKEIDLQRQSQDPPPG